MEIRRSEQIDELVKALASAGLEFEPILRDQVNPEFSSDYADLAQEIAHTKPALHKHGVVVLQFPRLVTGKNGRPGVEITTMLCCGNQFLAFELTMPAADENKFDAHTIGKAITYGRRYSYESALCISGEHDDDGNAAAGFPPRRGSKANGSPQKVGPQSQKPRQLDLAVNANRYDSSNGPFTPPDVKKDGYSL
jgi:ERF superfamily